MPTRLIILFCAALLGTACTTPAGRTAVAPDVGSDMVPVAATAEENPLVCKNVVQTGTRVAQRICMRRSQMDAHQRGAHEMLGEVQRRGVQVNETKE
ncbi:MAG: hypothetical protein WD795_19325 [Woeseia sp.]